MATLPIRNQQGQVIGERTVAAALETQPVHAPALHQAVVAQLANRRRGTACTKNRSEVRGSGRKLYRQKGTGRARMGANRSPLRVGGGVAFGPKPRSFRQNTPKKLKRLAFRSAIADKLQSGELVLVDTLQFERPRTKDMVAFLEGLNLEARKILVVLEAHDQNVFLSARNIPNVHVTTADLLNTYEVLWHEALVVTQEALTKIEERCGLASEATATEGAKEAEAV